jgi:putative endonuclease
VLPLRRRGSRADRASHLDAGRAAERRARRYYRARGYRILATNARVGRSEIDLIVRRGTRVVFCEVKMRSRLDFGDPVEMVNAEKERRLRRAASLWLARQPSLAGLDISFDIIGVHGRRIERIPSAF